MTPCREWQGYRNDKGYGRIRRNGRIWLLHRWVWTLANGPIPEGLHVLHACDNPPCFRLDHLWLGTHQDNIRDRDAKGRGRVAKASWTHCIRGHAFDEENTQIGPSGRRRCRACHRERERRYAAERKKQR